MGPGVAAPPPTRGDRPGCDDGRPEEGPNRGAASAPPRPAAGPRTCPGPASREHSLLRR
jgi:hypothetical protein